METNEMIIPDEVIMSKIYLIRGKKVMLDHDIANLYGVETKRLNEQVKRNYQRFPDSFMFQLTNDEYLNLKSQNATSSWGGRRKMPFVFTEHGILMLANVLKSDLAIKVSIRLIEVFIKIREMLLSHEDIQARIVNIEGVISEHKGILKGVLEYIKDIEQEKEIEKEQANRKRIGFKTKYDEGD